ncbi:hypothetical protein DU68_13890 [Methanosarcina mazei]|jgi:hypothetical protein|uniref:Uncharacterized protein n=1 Tax=Methanosarcina mazei TaxID=2209 RepID=A0A0F8L7E8_METMZ|nr:hypothetical protein DU34_16460 [Methanosarcina mazei]KKG35521.1 hypothetical protein DU52_04075 [Methanosarcina mazei]KKG40337.1 hypothetical protein DU41_10950 [Methanosarcina mazei]KKG60535.1 hypothetical protein DU67_01935 [Methanosarcina mazei]KKG69956.1 hypothetical protein DU46_13705 [Methanosarcina mazei]
MSWNFWVFSAGHSVFFQHSGLIIPFQEIENARKMYNDISFCSIPVNTVIEHSFLVETPLDSEDQGILRSSSRYSTSFQS